MKPNVRSRAFVSVGAAVAIVAAHNVQASASGNYGPSDDAREAKSEAEIIADQLGIPLAEYKLEQQLIGEIGELNAAVGTQQGMAQIWIDFEPFTVNISHTKNLGREARDRISRFSRQDLLRFHDAKVDLNTLEEWASLILNARDESRIHAAVSVDAIEGVIRIESNDPKAESLTRVGGLDASGVSVERVEGSGTSPTTWGAGTFANGCSAAFIVVNGGSYGVLGAGHAGCGGATVYTDRTSTYDTSIAFSEFAGRRDVAVHKLSSGTATNTIRVPFHPGARNITSTSSWSAMTVGQSVCKNGRASGWSCGQIVNKNISLSSPAGTNRFVETSNTCAGGDSGGSWTSNQQAYGIQSSKFNSNDHCIFGAIDYALARTDWSVRTS